MSPLYTLASTILTRRLRSKRSKSEVAAQVSLVTNADAVDLGKRWLLWVGCLFLTMLMLCVGAVIYGRGQPALDNLSSIHLSRCADLPCLKGIAPGQTLWSDAKAAWGSTMNSQITDRVIILQIGDTGRATLTRPVDDTTVKDFYIFVPPEVVVTIGDIIQEFGSPCGIGISDYPASNVVRFYYPWLYITAHRQAERLTMDMPVSYISYVSQAYRSRPQRDPCRPDFQVDISSQKIGNFSWQGFASLALYRKRQ